MASNKTATKKTTQKKTDTVVYRGQKYTVLERNNHHVCLTDGLIHFWVKVQDVKAD